MKLLYCENCRDARAMRPGEWAACWCGKSRGKYVDEAYAVLDGEHTAALGVDVVLVEAAGERDFDDREAGVRCERGRPFDAWWILGASPRITHARPYPCGEDTLVGSPGLGPVGCACAEWVVDITPGAAGVCSTVGGATLVRSTIRDSALRP